MGAPWRLHAHRALALPFVLAACSSSPSPSNPATPDAASHNPDAAVPAVDAGLTLNVPSPDGSEQVIYMVMIDRFATERTAAIYHWTPAISNYNDPNQEANYQVSDLDDLDSENPVVRTVLRDSYGYWVKTVGVDGFRVDTSKFVPHDFWNDFFHSTAGGPAPAPTVSADRGSKTTKFTYDRNAFGLASWSGVQIYAATWDLDGIGGGFRPLGPTAGPFTMGGGAATDPKIMDDPPVIVIP